MWEMWDFFKNVGHILQNVGNVGPLGTLQLRSHVVRFKSPVLATT